MSQPEPSVFLTSCGLTAEMLQQAFYGVARHTPDPRQMLDTDAPTCLNGDMDNDMNKPTPAQIRRIDEVLDYLVEHRTIQGEPRASHKQGWVSALLRLTEEITGETLGVTADNHQEYASTAAAVVYLEALGLVTVYRQSHRDSARANIVYRIDVNED